MQSVCVCMLFSYSTTVSQYFIEPHFLKLQPQFLGYLPAILRKQIHSLFFLIKIAQA